MEPALARVASGASILAKSGTGVPPVIDAQDARATLMRRFIAPTLSI